MHREHSQGAKEVLPGSRGPREPPVLLGAHFRSQGKIDRQPCPFSPRPPGSRSGEGAAGREEEEEGDGEEVRKNTFVFKRGSRWGLNHTSAQSCCNLTAVGTHSSEERVVPHLPDTRNVLRPALTEEGLLILPEHRFV